MVHRKAGGTEMAIKTKSPAQRKAKHKSLRASVSFPRELYTTLEQLAKEKKVSVAWIVREATEKYVSDKWPLFANRREGT